MADQLNRIKISEHFSLHEFACPCCKAAKVHPHLLMGLEKLRAKLRKPIRLSSAYRCLKHNLEIGGVADSNHIHGRAADIPTTSLEMTPLELARVCATIPEFKRIGVYARRRFVHVGVRRKPGKSNRWGDWA